jgi:PKD repeat protein
MTRKKTAYTPLVFLLLALFGSLASATTIILPTDEHLVDSTTLVVEGRVIASAPIDIAGGIWTETIIAVDRTLKGSAGRSLVIREVGGILGDRASIVFGTPEYTPGEKILVFLSEAADGTFRTRDLMVGKFDERWSRGRRVWHRDADRPGTEILEPGGDGPAKPKLRDAEAFEEFISSRARGLDVTAGAHLIDEPATEASESTEGVVSSNFTLIAEPTIYRWKLFEQGAAIPWHSHGSQPGYTSGGLSEMDAGLKAWTGYSEANIRMSYSGTTSTIAGLSKPNGVHEILFNDPLGEIEGSWTGNGGVVGRGGFNAARRGGDWTSPFTADSTHVQKTWDTWEILEGNLVIQDGVSPSKGISSTRLAEILAHEFGHTLGIGHSADGTALMYATLSGGGPTLRADDQVAARWLYPASSSAAPAPAPSPSASFSYSPASPSTDTTVSFTDQSSGSPTAWNWNFGDGTGSTQSNPAKRFNAAGTYTVTLTVSNASGSSQTARSIAVSAVAPPVEAAFSFSPSSPSTETTVYFTDQSAGSPTAWLWTFGDGTWSSQRSPAKQFSAAGTYTVTLTASNASGSSQTARAISVAPVAPAYPAVSAAFDVSPATAVAGQPVTFLDRSTGSPTSWSWSFGDGTVSSAQNPVRVYGTPGTYEVTLTASNGGGSSTVVRSIPVKADDSISRALIAASAEAPGAGGSEWRTELALFNGGEGGLTVDFTYIPGAGGTLLHRQTWLPAGTSVTWPSALRDLFGLVTATGAIAIDARSSYGAAALRISSRTFTTGQAGTYGQFVPGETREAGATTLYVTGLESSTAFRTNVGVVNTSGSWRQVRLTLQDAVGQTLAVRDETVAPNSFQQQAAVVMFPLLSGQSWDGMSLRITSDGTGIRAYASVVDNLSHDPIFVTATAPSADRDLTIPAIGRTAGAAGTYWRSDLALFNPHSATMTVALRYLPAGSDNRWAGARSITIGPGRSLVVRDLLNWFGISAGSGALGISWSGTPAGPILSARTYTTRADGGTLGQSMDAIPESRFAPRSAAVGAKSDGSFRTNIGVVNGDDAPATAWITITSPSGSMLGRAPVSLQPRSQAQYALAALFPHLTGTVGDFVVHADGGAKLFLYTSVVDNVSGDPLYIAGN